MQRRFAAFALLLGTALASGPAWAIDPGDGAGAPAVRHAAPRAAPRPGSQESRDPKRLWILLTTAEISLKDAADPAAVLALAASGKLRGVRLAVDSASPDPNVLQGALLLGKEEAPGGEIVFAAGGEKFWERLGRQQPGGRHAALPARGRPGRDRRRGRSTSASARRSSANSAWQADGDQLTESSCEAALSLPSAVDSDFICASNWRAAAIMATIVSTALTFEPSSAPSWTRASGSADEVAVAGPEQPVGAARQRRLGRDELELADRRAVGR